MTKIYSDVAAIAHKKGFDAAQKLMKTAIEIDGLVKASDGKAMPYYSVDYLKLLLEENVEPVLSRMIRRIDKWSAYDVYDLVGYISYYNATRSFLTKFDYRCEMKNVSYDDGSYFKRIRFRFLPGDKMRFELNFYGEFDELIISYVMIDFNGDGHKLYKRGDLGSKWLHEHVLKLMNALGDELAAQIYSKK